MEPKLCFIRAEYFIKNASFVNVLDAGNAGKQSRRTHLCVLIESNKRKDAGLDFRYALIVNEEEYIELQTEKKIPESQYRKIQNEYETISEEFKVYLNGFIKAAKKKRVEKEPLYREASLINFKSELGIKG